MNDVIVDIRVDLVDDSGLEELDEATVAALIQAGHTASIQATRALDGAIRIGSAEIADELFSSVQRLCFEGASALLVAGAVVDYPYFSSNANARLVADGDTVVVSGSDVPDSTFPRWELIRALYACGVRWLAMLDKIGRTPEANHLRPFAASAQTALAAAGLACNQGGLERADEQA
jgi:hypothetical protein